MALKVPFEGLNRMMDLLLGNISMKSDLVVRLYSNDYTPVDGSHLVDFVECDFDGYSPGSVANWGAGVLVPPRSIAGADAFTWTKGQGTNGNDVYGYFITLFSPDVVIWAERDPAAPVSMQVEGEQYIVVPRMSVRSEF